MSVSIRGVLKLGILRIACSRCRVLCSFFLSMTCLPQSSPAYPCPSPGFSALDSRANLSSVSFPSQFSFPQSLVLMTQNQSFPSEVPTFLPVSSYSPLFLQVFTFSVCTRPVSPSCGSLFTVSAVPYPTASFSQSCISSQFPNRIFFNLHHSCNPTTRLFPTSDFPKKEKVRNHPLNPVL